MRTPGSSRPSERRVAYNTGIRATFDLLPALSPLEFTWAAPGFRAFDAVVAAYFTLASNDRSGWGLPDRERDHFSHTVDVRVLCDIIDPRW